MPDVAYIHQLFRCQVRALTESRVYSSPSAVNHACCPAEAQAVTLKGSFTVQCVQRIAMWKVGCARSPYTGVAALTNELALLGFVVPYNLHPPWNMCRMWGVWYCPSSHIFSTWDSKHPASCHAVRPQVSIAYKCVLNASCKCDLPMGNVTHQWLSQSLCGY